MYDEPSTSLNERRLKKGLPTRISSMRRRYSSAASTLSISSFCVAPFKSGLGGGLGLLLGLPAAGVRALAGADRAGGLRIFASRSEAAHARQSTHVRATARSASGVERSVARSKASDDD